MTSKMDSEYDLPRINGLGWSEYIDQVTLFHGYAAPGALLGGIMVELAKAQLPQGILYDALVETASCLPDSVQMLTPCTIGNGWLKVINLGRYALTLYDKRSGEGIRIFVDGNKINAYPNLRDWFMNLVDKHDQPENVLKEEIRVGGAAICSIMRVKVANNLLGKNKKGLVQNCPICNEPYPKKDGGICRGCQGEHLVTPLESGTRLQEAPLHSVPVEQALGKNILHDMTQIIPEKSKGPVFKAGQQLNAGDLCRLHQMGRQNIFLAENLPDSAEWVHENEAAITFAKAMSGAGVEHADAAKEGKVEMLAAQDGIFICDEERLEAFNLIPGVMCASRHNYSLVKKGYSLAGTRSIPLYISRKFFLSAGSILGNGPLFKVLPLRKAKAGILITGTEVFRGLVEDKFSQIIRSKLENFNCSIVHSEIVPDEIEDIKNGIGSCLAAGADLIVTTAGLSVDPDDITRKALLEAGLEHDIFGLPVLPGTMTLVGRIKNAQVLGVPACALYHKVTAMDLMLPRLLAGLEIKRADVARLGHGGLCLECRTCTYPKCTFGK